MLQVRAAAPFCVALLSAALCAGEAPLPEVRPLPLPGDPIPLAPLISDPHPAPKPNTPPKTPPGAPAPQPNAKPSVSLAGLRVVAPLERTLALKQVFDSDPGTTVALLLHYPSAPLVKVDTLTCSITQFKDDKGADLAKRGGPDGRVIGATFSAEVAPARTHALVELRVPGLPGAGAAALTLQGALNVVTGQATEEVSIAEVPLRDGAKFTVKTLELTVVEPGAPEQGLEPLELSLRSFSALDSIASIKFFDATGKEIPARRSATSTTAVLGAFTEQWTYRLTRKADAAALKIALYTDLKRESVPVDLTVRLGQ